MLSFVVYFPNDAFPFLFRSAWLLCSALLFSLAFAPASAGINSYVHNVDDLHDMSINNVKSLELKQIQEQLPSPSPDSYDRKASLQHTKNAAHGKAPQQPPRKSPYSKKLCSEQQQFPGKLAPNN